MGAPKLKLVIPVVSTVSLFVLGSCASRSNNKPPLIVSPSAGGGADPAPPVSDDAKSPDAFFEQFLYLRPSLDKPSHSYLVSDLVKVRQSDFGSVFASLEVFLEADRRYTVRHSEVTLRTADDRLARRGSGGETVDFVKGKWRVDGTVLVLDGLGQGIGLVRDGQDAIELFVGTQALGAKLAGEKLVLVPITSDRGLDSD
jgi:hypothetical protein